MYKYELKDDLLVIYLEGNIDSTNAQNVESEIMEITSSNSFNYLLLDGADLKYISSAGLRIVLKLLRVNKNMEMINLSNEVYDIFDMTGFSKMMTVRKAFRTISLDGAKKIGEGAKGIVYSLNNDLIVKAYKGDNVLPMIQKEVESAKIAFLLGVPTAISYDIVRVGDSYGTVFELLDAKSMSNLISEDEGNLEKYAFMYVNLLKMMHSIKTDNEKIPSQMTVVNKWMNNFKLVASSDLFNKVSALIASIKETHTLIHGDFHSSNIMLQNGEPLLIDMDTLSYGNPILELAIIDFNYDTFNQFDENNSIHFLGIKTEVAKKFYELVINDYFLGKKDDEIKRNKERIKLLSLLRVINHTLRRTKDEKIIKSALDSIEELIKDINDLNLE